MISCFRAFPVVCLLACCFEPIVIEFVSGLQYDQSSPSPMVQWDPYSWLSYEELRMRYVTTLAELKDWMGGLHPGNFHHQAGHSHQVQGGDQPHLGDCQCGPVNEIAQRQSAHD